LTLRTCGRSATMRTQNLFTPSALTPWNTTP
jgi:hypothetical protein